VIFRINFHSYYLQQLLNYMHEDGQTDTVKHCYVTCLGTQLHMKHLNKMKDPFYLSICNTWKPGQVSWYSNWLCAEQLRGQNLSSNNGQGIKLTTHLQLVPWSRIIQTYIYTLQTSSWHNAYAYRQLYLILYLISNIYL
jgi:hypothetical protein